MTFRGLNARSPSTCARHRRRGRLRGIQAVKGAIGNADPRGSTEHRMPMSTMWCGRFRAAALFGIHSSTNGWGGARPKPFVMRFRVAALAESDFGGRKQPVRVSSDVANAGSANTGSAAQAAIVGIQPVRVRAGSRPSDGMRLEALARTGLTHGD